MLDEEYMATDEKDDRFEDESQETDRYLSANADQSQGLSDEGLPALLKGPANQLGRAVLLAKAGRAKQRDHLKKLLVDESRKHLSMNSRVLPLVLDIISVFYDLPEDSMERQIAMNTVTATRMVLKRASRDLALDDELGAPSVKSPAEAESYLLKRLGAEAEPLVKFLGRTKASYSNGSSNESIEAVKSEAGGLAEIYQTLLVIQERHERNPGKIETIVQMLNEIKGHPLLGPRESESYIDFLLGCVDEQEDKRGKPQPIYPALDENSRGLVERDREAITKGLKTSKLMERWRTKGQSDEATTSRDRTGIDGIYALIDGKITLL